MLAQVAAGGYLAGFSVLPHEWWHLGWLLVAGCAALVAWAAAGARVAVPRGAGAGPWLVAAYVLWMTLRSCCSDAFYHGHAAPEAGRGLLGVSLLVLFCLVLWPVARERRALAALGWVSGMAAAFAALLSLVLVYLVLPNHVPGERLQNLLVHGGLNPVCTGLIFGSAALWLILLVRDLPQSSGWRRVGWAATALLHLAAFFTGSRGVMLALVCGHGMLLVAWGWRRSAGALAVVLLTGLFYFTSAPLMARLAAWKTAALTADAPAVAGASAAAAAPEAPKLTEHLHKALARQDNGRLEIYHAGWTAVDNVWIGTGLWGMRDIWQCDLQPDPCLMITHLHSGFFATFVHGGLIGEALLLSLTAFAGCRAWRIARQKGDATPLVLLAFGCGGLLFDGESLVSLATAPRFEGLLYWLPVITALSSGSPSSQRDLSAEAVT